MIVRQFCIRWTSELPLCKSPYLADSTSAIWGHTVYFLSFFPLSKLRTMTSPPKPSFPQATCSGASLAQSGDPHKCRPPSFPSPLDWRVLPSVRPLTACHALCNGPPWQRPALNSCFWALGRNIFLSVRCLLIPQMLSEAADAKTKERRKNFVLNG